MYVSAAFFARVLRMRLSCSCTGFLPICQEVRVIYKTRNQLRSNILEKHWGLLWRM